MQMSTNNPPHPPKKIKSVTLYAHIKTAYLKQFVITYIAMQPAPAAPTFLKSKLSLKSEV